MTVAAYAPIPADAELTDAPRSNNETAALETPRVLFFAGDTITDAEKRDLPFKEFGGIFLPHVKTLGNKGMLYRCQFTRLPKYKMVGDNRAMLGPDAIHNHEDSFVQTVSVNGVATERTVKGFLESDPNPELKENGEFKNKRSNHIIYRKRYAAQDATLATQRPQFGFAPGGVIDITALMGATPAEVEEVQTFFFPNWNEIKLGVEQLPEDIPSLESYIKGRIEAVKTQSWDDAKKNKYFSIANDMLRSCADFTRFAKVAVKGDEIIVKDAATKGAAGTITHSTVSDKYLDMTKSHRKDDLITNQADSIGEMTREMREDRAAKQAHDAKLLLLEERKQYTAEITAGLRERDTDEEIRLGIRKVTVESENIPVAVSTTNPIIPTTVEDMTATVVNNDTPPSSADIRICGKPTASGECKRELKEGDVDACWQHREA